tara:strand:- start:30 stop:305 length:276 start_codon:yes stop_codon:yes gene_type:complete
MPLLLFLRLVTVMKNDTFPDRFGPSFDRRRKPFDLATFVTSTDVLLLLRVVVVVVALRSSKEEECDDVLMTIYHYPKPIRFSPQSLYYDDD